MPTSNPAIPNLEKRRDLNLALAPAQPLVLFPVRLETRFFPQPAGGFELRVRVYPDQVHIDAHEPDLTADELIWGKHFWEQTWRAGNDEARSKAAWRQLADRFDPPRAAWVARALHPQNSRTDFPDSPLDPNAPLSTPIRFPTLQTKAEPWMRAPHTHLLPSRWIALGYQHGQLVVNVQSNLIVEPLATGPTPLLEADTDATGIDKEMRWLVDFAAAEAAGMAMRAQLTALEAAAGLDFLLVLGIKDAAGATNAGAQRLAELFNAHHYTDGLSFLAQGTPTNNTKDAASGFSSQDPGHEESYGAERAGSEILPDDGSNAAVLTRALGLANAGPVFANLPHAAAKAALDAKHMNTALWQATWGYFLLQMLGVGGVNESPLLDEDIAWVRDHFIAYVRAGGPLPAVRVGKQPYGVLPVTSLDAWKAQPGQESQARREVALRDFLIRLRDNFWRRNVAEVPRLGRSEEIDPATGLDKDLAEVLSMDSLSSSYSIRHVMGRHYLEHLWVFMTADLLLDPKAAPPPTQSPQGLFRTWFTGQAALADAVPQALGVRSQPRLARAVFSSPAAVLQGALVQADQGHQLAPNYIAALLAAPDLTAILQETLAQPSPATLLYLLLRHSMLLEYVAAGAHLLALQPAQRREQELVGMVPDAQALSHVIHRLDTEISRPDGSKVALGKYLFDFADRDPALQSLNAFRMSLKHISNLPVATLEQLLTGTLDLCSHRLDAWITSLATRRLDEMRQADPNSVLVGGYGWVMNLKPGSAQTAVDPVPGEAGPIFQAATNPGFIHTPSLAQAATAAVLRSGHLAHAGGQTPNDPLAIDLSSARVRLAEWLLDGVRQGQPLAALLGYRFERSLHEGKLDQFIAVFRRIAPFGELLNAEAAQKKANAEAGRLKAALDAAMADLNRANQRHRQLLTEQNGLPGRIAAAESNALKARNELARLKDVIDGINGRIQRAESAHPPQDTTKLEADLDREERNQAREQGNLDRSLADLQQARERSQTITLDLKGAAIVEQQAQQNVTKITGPLDAAQQASAEAAADYQKLLEQHRRRLQFSGDADQRALESVAEIQVTDGLALLKLWQEGKIVFGEQELPAPGSNAQRTLSQALDALADAVDAVSDALLAESVYQTVRGNLLRAASTVEAIAGGEAPPPELEVVRTPRTGIALTHRLVTLFSGEPQLPSTWTTPAISARADAEPHLNAWSARLLGDPAQVRCLVERLAPETGAVTAVQEVRLNELQMAPLDFIYAAEGGPGGQQAEIEQRILYAIMRRAQEGFPASVPPSAQLRINPSRRPAIRADELSYSEFSELLRAVRKLFGGMRGIDGNDLNLPERNTNAGVDSAELERRADRAVQALRDCRRDLNSQVAQPNTANLPDVRNLLLRAAGFGIAGAVPLSPMGEFPTDRQILLAQARSIESELAKRTAQLDQLPPSAATAESQRTHALQRLQIVFGKGFIVLPRFTAANQDELEQALANSLQVQEGNPLAANIWFQRMARVRDGLGRLNDVLVYTEALGHDETLKLSIAQLPHKREDRWVGLPLRPKASLPGGKLALAVQAVTPVDVRQPLAGLLVDEWVEVVPSATETTGLAFQYDQPNSAPPQTILIAVPPEVGAPWTIWSLQKVLLETLDLARLRAVDPDALDEVGHYLPAAYFALNLSGATVSTDFTRLNHFTTVK